MATEGAERRATIVAGEVETINFAAVLAVDFATLLRHVVPAEAGPDDVDLMRFADPLPAARRALLSINASNSRKAKP